MKPRISKLPISQLSQPATPATIIALLAAAFYIYKLGNLFPLIEYRQWINVSDPGASFQFFWDNAVLHLDGISGAFSRSTSLLSVSLISAACGFNSRCHDSALIGILLIALFCTIAIMFRFKAIGSRLISSGCIVFVMMSQPMIDSIAWQATSLDKLGMFFTATFTLFVLIAPLQTVGLRRRLLQAGLLAFVVITVNSKEAAWCVVPSVGLLLFFRLLLLEDSFNWPAVLRSAKSTLVLFWPALAYFLFHTTIVLLGFRANNEIARVTAGDPLRNVAIFFAYLFNIEGTSAKFHMGYAIAVSAVATIALALIVSGRSNRRLSLFWLWSLLSFFGAMLIPLKTTGPSPFYLLIPIFYLTLAIFSTSAIIAENLARTPYRFFGAACFLAFIFFHVYRFTGISGQYFNLSTLSDNFKATLRKVGDEIKDHRPSALVFVYPPDVWRAYMFTGSTGPKSSALAAYILPPGSTQAERAELDEVITDEALPPGSKVVLPPNGTEVELRRDLTLERFVRQRN